MKLVIRSSMLRGSRMKVGRVTRESSAPGRSWLMMWVRTLPCSEDTTVSSSSVSLPFPSRLLRALPPMLFLWMCPRTMLGDQWKPWRSRLQKDEELVCIRRGVVLVQCGVSVGVRERERRGRRWWRRLGLRQAQHSSKQASTFRSGWLVGKGCDRVRHPPCFDFWAGSSCAVSLCVMSAGGARGHG